mgnify:FL=1
MKQKIIAIVGPTAVGKSKMAVLLAKKFDGEIISADSIQLYKDLNIGSAKVTKKEMEGVKHYGIDIALPITQLTAFDFVQNAKGWIQEISKKNKLPIIVGGTALYVKALLENYNLGATRDEKLRENLKKEYEQKGLQLMAEKLKKTDSILADKTDLSNPVRVLRALEIALSNSEKSKQESEFDYKLFALNVERELLYKRINFRVDRMFEEGLESEVQNILAKYGENAPAFKAIGYKEFLPYFKKEISKEDLILQIKQHSRNYAKRQLTFIRGMSNVQFVDVQNFDQACKKIEKEIENWLQ